MNLEKLNKGNEIQSELQALRNSHFALTKDNSRLSKKNDDRVQELKKKMIAELEAEFNKL